MKVGVIALGSWGTAIANLLADNGHHVVAYARDEAFIAMLERERENKKYLPGVRLHDEIQFTHDIRKAVADAEMIVSAIPTQGFRDSYASYRDYIPNEAVLVNLAKGIEIKSGLTLSKVANTDRYVLLSGPTHAEEVAARHPSAIVAASENAQLAETVQHAFSNDYFRVYRSDDLEGVEIAGALKNVIAVAAGIVDGIGYGDNAKAALITRGLAEITRFGMEKGARKETFSGLAGVGDMIVTCGSRHSRNLRCGELIGKGETLDSAVAKIGMVVEGVHTIRAVMALLAQMPDIEMPITEMLYKIIYEGLDARQAIRNLMTRKTKHENE
ncbi:MAG: NAD(P)H-dependent glycerol-3-phosphate dehydrogenase [Bacillota bacterium]|nr:NAD(P)H-dependent glycerol-3-phosphate dehydrogenase [Bacillota bacterium]